MENSILDSTKKVLGMDSEYLAFDLDIITHINSAFAVLFQLGVGPTAGFYITGNTELWDDYEVPDDQKNLIKTYIILKTRMLFDPPSTSYLIEAMNKQIAEYEWRISASREDAVWTAQQI